MRPAPRMSLALLAAAALGVAGGCGGEPEVERGAPAQSPPPVAATPEPPGGDLRVGPGEIGVAGIDGRGGVRPERLEVARDLAVEALEWTAWEPAGARATGRARLLDCDPSCAQGSVDRVAATVELSDPVACPGGRFFSRARVRLEGTERQPASWVQAPC